VVDADGALALVPALVQPVIRSLGLPGFLLVDRVESA
jgi:hypothetical protein